MMRCAGYWLSSAILGCASVRLQGCVEAISSLMHNTAHQPHSASVAASEDQEQYGIPLLRKALWAAQRLQQHDNIYAFPRYCDGKICNANSASAALNKWMKTIIGGDYVVHGLRHSFRDRMRAFECPSDIIDQIGGWTTTGIGKPMAKPIASRYWLNGCRRLSATDWLQT